MHRTLTLQSLPNTLRLGALLFFLISLHGCALIKRPQEKVASSPLLPATMLERNDFAVAQGEDVIGRVAAIRLAKGDTLPDIARHFSLGVNAIGAANPGTDLWVPETGALVMLPLRFILPDSPREGIVVNLGNKRIFHYKKAGKTLTVSTYPVGIGAEDRPTPTGRMRIVRKAHRPTWYVPASIAERHRKKGDPLPAEVPPGPQNPLGEYALYLSKPTYLIHGTNKTASVGLDATNGCLRLYPENIQTLYDDTPVNTPVAIVDQPYLIGQRDGVLYLEAHAPQGDTGTVDTEPLYAKLRRFEKTSGRALNWEKIRQVINESRGIPVPVFAMSPGVPVTQEDPVEVQHPGRLYGKPEIPALELDSWYVLAAEVSEEVEALRLAAIINHQGPPIPARVLSKQDRHRVIAGPFNDASEARDAARRLRIDLGLDSLLIEPVGKG